MHPPQNPEPSPRQKHTKWTAAERAKAQDLYSQGVRPTDAFAQGEFPGRNKQFVWNIFAQMRQEATDSCPCGSPREEGFKRCASCMEKGRARLDALKAQGLCTQCARNPANATLTRCRECLTIRRARSNKSTDRVPRGSGSVPGLFRWLCSGSPKDIGQHLPVPVQDWTVVDVFGGSGAFTLFARREGYRVVYNDVNPRLCNVVRTVRDGDVDEFVANIKSVSTLTPSDLGKLYARADQLPPLQQASVLSVMATNVAHRNMYRKILPETLRAPGSDFFKRLKQDQKVLQGVDIITQDFAEVIKKFDGPRTMFILDPPFANTLVYEHNLTQDRFMELGQLLSSIRGRFLLMSDSTRITAEAMAGHPHVWWWLHRQALTTVRQLVSTNYEIDLEPVDLAKFGVKPPPKQEIPPPGFRLDPGLAGLAVSQAGEIQRWCQTKWEPVAIQPDGRPDRGQMNFRLGASRKSVAAAVARTWG